MENKYQNMGDMNDEPQKKRKRMTLNPFENMFNKDGKGVEKSELKDAKKVLSAAAMTYVAALAVSLAQLLRFFLIVAANTRRRD